MSKQKAEVSEYKFKVREISEIDKERICRENPNAEMIIVIPDTDQPAILIVDRLWHNKHTIWDKLHWESADNRHRYVTISKESISDHIREYQEIKAKKNEPPKQEVTVKVFGEKENKIYCKNCQKELAFNSIGFLYHTGNQSGYCYLNWGKFDDGTSIPKAEPYEKIAVIEERINAK